MVRGNVETRLNQALDGRLDAVVLAWAGLSRLGLETHVTQRLEPPDFLPAVGQGRWGSSAGAMIRKSGSYWSRSTTRPVTAPSAAERTALAELEGGCIIPMGGWARDIEGARGEPDSPAMAIAAAVFDPDGRNRLAVVLHGPRDHPDRLGQAAAQA